MCHRSRILILIDSAFKAAPSSFFLNTRSILHSQINYEAAFDFSTSKGNSVNEPHKYSHLFHHPRSLLPSPPCLFCPGKGNGGHLSMPCCSSTSWKKEEQRSTSSTPFCCVSTLLPVHAAPGDHCKDYNTFIPVQLNSGNCCWMGWCWWKCKDATAGRSKLQITAWMRAHWESLTL